MTTILNSETTLKELTETIQSLSLKEKYQLLEIIEQQIFEAEEENHEDDREILDEIETIQNGCISVLQEYSISNSIPFLFYRGTGILPVYNLRTSRDACSTIGKFSLIP